MAREVLGAIISTDALKEKVPVSQKAKMIIEETMNEVKDVLAGRSNKKIMIVGPCSADFPDSLLEYAKKLKALKEQYGDQFIIVMRFYTGKPRTVGGWKGIQQGPLGESIDRDDSIGLNEGLEMSRKLALQIIEESGIGLADEMLHPQFFDHLRDIYSYLAVGARSTENPYHREVASGTEMAVGMKNGTDGGVKTGVNSVQAAQMSSVYSIGDTAYRSTGNEYAHLILRGGNGGPNYQIEYIEEAYDDMVKRGIKNPAIIIDLNHENSGKKPEKQIEIMQEVIGNLRERPKLQEFVKGFMIESYLYTGRQDIPKNGDMSSVTHGLSLTDPCIGIEETETLIATGKRLYAQID